MNNKYLNLFWGVLATVIIFHEFTDGQIDSIIVFGKKIKLWVLVIAWGIVGLKNYYCFLSKVKRIV